MQVIEVGVRNQNQIDRRKIGNPESRTAQALQHKQPARKIGIDEDVQPANLHEETGVTDEGEPQFSITD